MSGCIQIVYSGRQGSQCGEPTDGEDHDFCPYHEAPELWDGVTNGDHAPSE